MELQFRRNVCKCLGRAVREVQNTELTQEIRLTDGMPDIGRVLASWGQVILRSKEWRADTVSVSGGVMVWALYAPEDGSDPRSIDAWIPFQLKWDLPVQDREGPVRVFPLLRFVDGRTISARKIMVRAGVAAMGEALYPMEAEVSAPEELPEDVQILQNTYPVRLPKEAGEKMFLVDEEISIPTSDVPEKLLSYSLTPGIQDKKVLVNKVVFRGESNLHLVYRGQDGRIHTWDTALPFSQFADLEGSYSPDAQADVQTAVTSLELDLNDQGLLRLKSGLVSQYLVTDRELMELTEDAYSPSRDVEVYASALELPSVLEDRKETISVEQTLGGQSGEVVDITFFPDFPRCQRHTDALDAQLQALFQVLYYGDDGMLRTAAARWEGNLHLPASEASRIDLLALPQGNPQARSAGEDMMLTGEFLVQVNTTADQGLPMINGLQLGEQREPDPNRPSLILCRSDGEDLWSLAKRCNSTVGAIQTANGLQEDPAADRILLIPVS